MGDRLVYPTCIQIRPSGRLCGCPALKDRPICYQHSRERQRQRNLRKAREIKELSNPKRGDDYRPLEDLDAVIWESLEVPPLEDGAAIAIASTAVMNAMGSRHLDPVRAKIMGNLIRIAEINLRQGHAFASKVGMTEGLVDPEPIKPLGDAEGFVMPEEGPAQRSHQQLKRDLGADRANEIRTEMGYNDHMFEPLAVTPTPVAATEKKPSTSAPAPPEPAEKKPSQGTDSSVPPREPVSGRDFSRADEAS